MKIILAEDGTKQQTVRLEDVKVRDLWHLAMELPKDQQEKVLEVWHLAHDLLGALRSIENGADIKKPVHTK